MEDVQEGIWTTDFAIAEVTRLLQLPGTTKRVRGDQN